MKLALIFINTILEKGFVEFDIPFLTQRVAVWRLNITHSVEVFIKPIHKVENAGCDSTAYAELLVIDEFAENKAKDLAQYLMAECHIDECFVISDGQAQKLYREN